MDLDLMEWQHVTIFQLWTINIDGWPSHDSTIILL